MKNKENQIKFYLFRGSSSYLGFPLLYRLIGNFKQIVFWPFPRLFYWKAMNGIWLETRKICRLRIRRKSWWFHWENTSANAFTIPRRVLIKIICRLSPASWRTRSWIRGKDLNCKINEWLWSSKDWGPRRIA